MNNNPRIKEVIDRFSKTPLLFEVIPPEVEAETETLEIRKENLLKLTEQVDPDGFNLPEIREESAKSEKGERKSDFKPRLSPRKYAGRLQNLLDSNAYEYVICRVIVHARPTEQEKWLLETAHDYDIRNIVVVGGEQEADAYNGLSVPEGNKLIRNRLNRGQTTATDNFERATDYLVGNISIPTRRLETLDEPQRISYKIKAGADFFSTQIICEKESPVKLLDDLDEELSQQDLDAPAFFWSFAPIAEQKDVNFMRWLGVEIPETVEEKILSSSDPVEASIDHAVSILDAIQKKTAQMNNQPLNGVNVSFMGLRNFDNAIRLAKELSKVL